MILILGVNGQLGSSLATLLEQRGQAYRGLDRPEIDIVDFDAVRSAMDQVRPDLVINCAAFTDVDGAESQWKPALAVNALGVRNLAVACQDRRIPLAHISTDYVFDGQNRQPYTLDDEPRPINRYGQSKLLGERLLMALTDRFYLIRTSWLFGKGRDNFLAKLLGWASGRETLRVVSDQVSGPTFAPDLARAILAVVRTGLYGMYHYRNAGQCSRYEWARFALVRSGWTGRVEPVTGDFFPTPAKRPAYSVLEVFPLDQMGIEMPSWEQATVQWLEGFR